MPAHILCNIIFSLSGELNRDQPQIIRYGNMDDTRLGKYLTKTTLLLLLPLASMYTVFVLSPVVNIMSDT